jgi:hypothetical protein
MVVNTNDEPVAVSLGVENDAITRKDARISVDGLYVIRRSS